MAEKRRRTPSELYTTEASESRKQSVSDQTVPDPKPEEGETLIGKYIVEEDDGDPN